MIKFEDVKNNKIVRTYVEKADETLNALGFTEHCFAHVTKVAENAGYILETLGYDKRTVELSKIAAFLHDIGNIINRVEHSQSGAVMSFRILDRLGMEPEEIASVISAIGNHDEGIGFPVNEIAAALIIADKADVRKTRVRNIDIPSFDIHDRVNYSVEKSDITVMPERREIRLDITIDTSISSVLDYFEIFLDRMLMCKKAAEKLNTRLVLMVNNQKLL